MFKFIREGKELLNTNQVKEYIVGDVKLNNVLSQYKNVFNSELGTIKNVKLNQKLSPMQILTFAKLVRCLIHLLIELKQN